jgi:DNA-binding NarL/FixJ family response regulator
MLRSVRESVFARPLAPERRNNPEFLVVCSDNALFRTVASAIRLVNGRMNCAASISPANNYISRRKVDGIVIDMGLPGALDLIAQVRRGSSNRSTVVFACMGSSPENQFAIRAGANFVLHRPLLPEKVAHIFTVAAGMMVSEKRRYFRYPLMVPVEITMKERQVESTMSNLSEGGMAIWSLYYHAPGSRVQFAFEIPFGGLIRGNGEVAWTNADGLAGIKFNIMNDYAYTQFSAWIARRHLPPGA